jgi:hypothetical protein
MPETKPAHPRDSVTAPEPNPYADGETIDGFG